MTIRESFEQWLHRRGITPQYTLDRQYSDHDVRIMWEAWQPAWMRGLWRGIDKAENRDERNPAR